MVKSWNDGSAGVVGGGAFLAFVFAIVLVGIGVADAAPPDCKRIAESVRARDCCGSNGRSCGSLWASFAKRGCTGDPCWIGCGVDLCDAGKDEYCCNASCSLCVPSDQTCPQEICVD